MLAAAVMPKPQPIADVLSRLIARRGYARVQSGAELLAAWRTAAGPLAAHTLPGELSRGVLRVQVRHSTLMQELTFAKAEILTKLTALLPEQNIRELRFRVGAVD